MPLSLAHVQELLRQEPYGARGRTTASKKPEPLSHEQLRQIFLRPLPRTLYKCPISEPKTTIVPYSWLPRQVQERIDLTKSRIFATENDNDDDVMVEIPVGWMQVTATDDQAATLVAGSLAGQQRQGN